MNSVQQKWIAATIAAVLLITLLLFVLIPFLVKPDLLKQFLVRSVEEQTNFQISVERPAFSLFPVPTFRFLSVQLKLRNSPGQPVVVADEFQCRIRLLPLLFRQIEFSKMFLKGANITVPAAQAKGIPASWAQLRNVSLELDNVRSKDWIRFKLEGAWCGDKTNLFVRGKAKIDFNQMDFDHTALSCDIKSGPILLDTLIRSWSSRFPYQVKQGALEWRGKIEKTIQIPEILLKGDFNIKQLIYAKADQAAEVVSLPADYHLMAEVVYDTASGVFSTKSSELTTPFAHAKVNGKYNTKNQEFKEVRLTADTLTLDHLPKYLLPLVNFLPVNVGFAGNAKIDTALDGNPDNLTINMDVDFTEALLSYGRFFEKPKSVPARLHTSDLLLQHGKDLKGAVGIDFDRTKLKATIAEYDAATGAGEISLITNVLSLDGWEKFLPFFSEYHITGGMKIFVSGKGNLFDARNARWMYNLSFDRANASLGPNLPLVQNLSGSIDGGPMELETRDLRFDVGSSPVLLQVKMFLGEVTRAVVVTESPELNVPLVIASLKNASHISGTPLSNIDWDLAEKNFLSAVPANLRIEDFSMETSYENKHLDLTRFHGGLYDGDVIALGSLDWKTAKPSYRLELEAERIQLARLPQASGGEPLVAGSLYLYSQLSGEGFAKEDLTNSLKGEAKVTITNGEFRTFDVLGSLGTVGELMGLQNFVSGKTQFHDVNTKFTIQNGKIQSDHVLLYSDDLYVDGAGDIDLEGNLNFRLQAALGNELSRKINPSVGEEGRLGPIPLLLTGKISKPDLKADPSLIKSFLVNLAQQRLSKIISSKKLPQTQEPLPSGSPELTKSQDTTPQKKDREELAKDAVQTGMTLLESLFEKRQ